jgi:hypothetical protein
MHLGSPAAIHAATVASAEVWLLDPIPLASSNQTIRLCPYDYISEMTSIRKVVFPMLNLPCASMYNILQMNCDL